MVWLRSVVVVVVGLSPCCGVVGCGFDAVRRCQGRRFGHYGALEGLKEKYGRFDGILWHREQGRKAVKGMGNVTSQRTCRVTRISRGIIVSLCTYIHTYRPTSIYVSMFEEGGLVSVFGRVECVRRSRLFPGQPGSPFVCVPTRARRWPLWVGIAFSMRIRFDLLSSP